ncbi:MAG: exodeoxyribonuclease V subunit gamma [Desulfobulbaceae bacterium]|nr:exodeoxyribonuclease V subunit gamma [Desulfobulbaceae bacterium]
MHLYQSNRLENLFNRLCSIITTPLSDPLSAEVIVVQNQGMARWLSQQIALKTGIAANLQFPLPARFIWDIFAGQFGKLPEDSTFDRPILPWRILALLPALCRNKAFSQLAGYLSDDPDGGKLFQLAGKIGDLFDQYLVYRPDLLAGWEQGKSDDWQAHLWRQLTTGEEEHRGQLLQRFFTLCATKKLNTEHLPERVCLFGISTLAPAYLAVIERVSVRVPVHLFHLSPCSHYWGDLFSNQALARKRKQWRRRKMPDVSQYYESGNPLLASLGTAGMNFFRQLMEFDLQEEDFYTASGRSSLLGSLQDDVLELKDRTSPETVQQVLARDDNSLQFHTCHSPMREVQVLHDRLLDLFCAIPDLKPADILVMAPDIEHYAPAVSGVFGAAEHYLPWSLADRPRHGEQPLLQVFLELLSLMSGRFTAPEVLAWLESEAVLNRFQLDAADLARLRSWVGESGIRWGLDLDHRKQIDVETTDRHTWKFGLDRLLLGYIMGADSGLYRDIMPCAQQSGNDPMLLGSLAAVFNEFTRWRSRLRRLMKPKKWSEALLQLLEAFFNPGPDDESLPGLREQITAFADHCNRAGFSGELSLQVVRTHFEKVLAEPAGGQAFLNGRVTFCNMVPMRSIPFRVICLLGMNDTDYPRSRRPLAFDLMAQHPRIGDRCKRDDDRYLFLEALLSARDCLYISWVGRDQHDNAALAPSVVVSELRDYIDRGFASDNGSAREQLTTRHPLQPFSRRYFDGSQGPASYSELWIPGDGIQEAPVFLPGPLPEPEPEWLQVDIGRLAAFWSHPVRFFLQQRLGLRLRDEDDALLESEPFALDSLQQYQIGEETTAALLTEANMETHYLRLQASGTLPHGGFGLNLHNTLAGTAGRLIEHLRPLTLEPLEPLEIDHQIGGFRLIGWLPHLYPAGRITWRTTSCKAKDLLHLWVFHLALNLLKTEGMQQTSHHVATDTTIVFTPVSEPEVELNRLLELYWQGLREPLHFYPRTSHARATAKPGWEQTAAEKAWNSGFNYTGEGEDIAYRIALQGREPLDDCFVQLTDIFTPLLNHIEDNPSLDL